MTTKEQRTRWEFVERGDDWLWRKLDASGAVTESARFARLRECIEDARLHGYVPWAPEKERRKRYS